jgi:hypothetical protein
MIARVAGKLISTNAGKQAYWPHDRLRSHRANGQRAIYAPGLIRQAGSACVNAPMPAGIG